MYTDIPVNCLSVFKLGLVFMLSLRVTQTRRLNSALPIKDPARATLPGKQLALVCEDDSDSE